MNPRVGFGRGCLRKGIPESSEQKVNVREEVPRQIQFSARDRVNTRRSRNYLTLLGGEEVAGFFVRPRCSSAKVLRGRGAGKLSSVNALRSPGFFPRLQV